MRRGRVSARVTVSYELLTVKKREDVTQSAVDDSKQGFMDNITC